MRSVLTYFLLFLVIGTCGISLTAQGQITADSLKNRLNDSRSQQTLTIRDDFLTAWPRLGPEIQDKAMRQVAAIMNKKYSTRGIIDLYFRSIAAAKDIEFANDPTITPYLNVMQKMIDNHDKDEILTFLRASTQFFEHHALYYANASKLYVQNDAYQFQYIEAPEIEEAPVEEEPEEEVFEEEESERFEDWDEEEPDEDWDTEWDDSFPDEDTGPTQEELLAQAITGGNVLPVIEGPVITFDEAELNFVSQYDSVFLKNTSGSYLLLSRQFVGKEGRFNWTMAGLGEDSVYCELTDYSLDVTKSKLRAEAARLTYIGKLESKIDGVFEYKSSRHDSTTDASYPRFQSYYSNIPVKGLGEGFIYRGGFSLKGAKINSSSVFGDGSLIEVQDATSRKFRARADIFEFQDSLVSTKRARVVIYQGNDSIYHPAVRLNYDLNSKYLTLQKDKGGYRNTPYTATYFNIDFTADIIRWDLNSDSLDASILEARKIVPAYFESSDHYNKEDYRSLGDKLYDFNPLGIVTYYASKKRVDEFYVSDLAKFYKKDELLLRGAMLYLAQKGLIGYDYNNGLVTVKKKARHLFNSKRGKKDFDNIIIASVIDTSPNATLNFAERQLTVRGVESFRVSDSLNVIIEPDSSEITLLRDRDIRFDGKIYAGNFEYIGRDFTFKYDSFLIYLNQIDSIEFFVKDENSRGNQGRRKVKNALVSSDSIQASSGVTNNLQSGSGTLFINKPNNKSSKKKYLNYPRFNSEKGQVAYFDKNDVLDGVYDKSLYFLVPPFDLDSLGGSDPAAIGFKGTFGSSGMFPDFEETLRIQPDFSLGFQHDIPPEGYALYEGEGRLFNKLSLDSRGLRGTGRIDFLTTSLESEDFIFYPDSVTGSGNYFEIREAEYNGVIFPQASLANYEMLWLPKKDSMYIKSVEDPFQFYNETASLDGTAIVTNNGVYGSGLLATRGSHAKSDKITLKNDQFYARHAEFDLESSNPEKPALHGDDVRLKFNLNENYAVISPEVEGEAAIEFPYAQFKTSITEARWDLEEQKITMIKPDDVPIESSYFYTTRKDLDSLRFNATKAEYDINSLELKVSGIPYIIVADAKITPENNEVLILENSRIGQLTNTTIILDTLYGYHRLTEGVIDIKSRNEFSGYATYQFINALNDTIPIKMEDFHLEDIPAPGTRRKDVLEKHTVANGSVAETQNVLVSPGMYYKGDLILYAHQPAMELSGYVKLDLDEPGYNTWINHSSSADQQEVMIDYDNSTTEDGRRLEAGLHFAAGDNSLYHSFITEKFTPDDEDFFTPSGLLFYDEKTNEFVIEDTVKGNGNAFAGKIFRYNQATSELRFEGPATFIAPSKDADIKAAVIGHANINDVKYKMNSLFSIDFKPVPTQAFDIMAVDILDVVNNLGAPEGLGDQTELLYKLADIAGERAAREYEQRSLQDYVPLAGFTKETSTSMVFANVDMIWSVDFKAFYSEGKLGLSNLQRSDINGAFDGFMEAKRNEDGGPVFNLFLKASADSWYYFSYEDSRLLIYSSNNSFNTVISKKSNGAKAKIGDLVFAPGDKAETLNFINRFRLQYYGIEEPYQLDSDVEEEETKTDPDADGEEETSDDDGFDDDDDGF
ncbi:hypothetical protein FNH22_00920 [Fulvivirga sp. M361]|uniref:hypothetical protein n=1 Tax=Fulvivirga sp. M361 TaxID=2594266 RepID=UPI00117B76F4|nr:hypothetical protein [Fulvivirga sp. M361]TRX62688.1 hypothetical protein FNH22_00920 [Fulvivirga sp. M361]